MKAIRDNIVKVQSTERSTFVLTRKQQKGQVAIFVALIFQVIFIFFAILINVGLLVHHKINLQQSVDLAAYYGAMKQAENMNAVAHINFQIKQAWKLLTWRYRILGTFGFRKGDSISQKYPFEHVGLSPGNFNYNGEGGLADPLHPGGMKCNNVVLGSEKLGVQDIPFFCIGHAGFKDWYQGESNCQLDCAGFDGAREIPAIPSATSTTTPFGGNVAGSINLTIDSVNKAIESQCKQLGPKGANLLSRFVAGYINDTQPRIKSIEALASNLALDADKILDIEGQLIQKGSLNTFKNNLTEANLTGFQPSEFKAENGLGQNGCGFTDGLGTKPEFLKKIEINFINYFIHNCIYKGGANYKPENVFAANGDLGPAFSGIPANVKNIILSVLNEGQRHTVGYEKNPYCVEYYAVRASTEPQIPFLPLAKIKLNAVAVAKPFGGSIGPWYFKTWPVGETQSKGDDNNQQTKVDETLPLKQYTGADDADKLSKSVYTQPNFSIFVGDKKGLRDGDYIAAYHSALAIRDINNRDGNPDSNRNTDTKLANTGGWPNYDNWTTIDNAAISDFRDYDTLASNDPNMSGMRALEISAIAPNQFDITHYSIDPDFYNNYYKKLYNSGLSKILAATGKTDSMKLDWLRADFGAVGMRADQEEQPPPLTERTFSVKDQILLKNIVLNTKPTQTTGMPGKHVGKEYSKILNHLISLQSSLLTSWTYLGFTNYTDFPEADKATSGTDVMLFGHCKDSWNDTIVAQDQPTSNENFKTPMDKAALLPPTPGNCVTGGRTGYSVKIVSPKMVRDKQNVKNFLPDSFFDF